MTSAPTSDYPRLGLNGRPFARIRRDRELKTRIIVAARDAARRNNLRGLARGAVRGRGKKSIRFVSATRECTVIRVP